MRTAIVAIRNLNITVNTFLQYFVWSSFNDRLQQQMIQITNTNKPSIQQIETNLFPALERYNIVSEKQ